DRLTAADLVRLRPLALRTIVDLRTHAELETRGGFPADVHPVTYRHVSVFDETWDRPEVQRPSEAVVAYLHFAYTRMLDQGGPRFAAAVETLGDAGAMPAVFHCVAGKDRTGLLAALVLGA